MLAALVRDLDDSILDNPALSPSLLAEFIAAQKELGLVFGDRPTCPFLRPHIISRSQYDEVTRAARTIAGAFEKVTNAALQDEEMLRLLGLTDAETRMARVAPGYSRLCVSSRLDAYLSDGDFKFLEYNAETPAGVGDQMQLEKVLFGFDHLKQLLERKHWLPEPHRRLIAAMLEAYRDGGGEEERPQIAIVDWKGVSTESEFRILQQYFADEGYPTRIVDPRDLSYDGKHLSIDDFRIDIVYKRVVIHEFLERCGEDHPLARAYKDGRVCVVNSFRTKIPHKKSCFAVLSDSRYGHLFTTEEQEVFKRHVPWTRRLTRDATTFEGREQSMLDLLRRERQQFVLKPNDDYGGHGVFLGWEMDAGEWDGALALALERPYVAQQRVPLKLRPMPTFGDGIRLDDVFVDFNPFLFDNEPEGALIRLSSSSLLNVTSGGGQTALLVLEDC